MGNLFGIRILTSIYEKPAARPSDEPLQPFIPGAWAVWARAHQAESDARAASPKTSAPAISLTPVAR